jgi:hypothetical protein
MFISSTKRHLSAVTLVEILISAAIFVGIGVVLVMVQSFCSRSMLKTNNHTDTYRMSMLTLNRIKTELYRCRVISVVPTYVEYKLPALQSDGTMQLSALSGLPIWLPQGTTDHYIMKEASGKVVAYRDGGASRILLGNLGAQGTILFLMPLPELIEVRVHAEAPDPGLRGRASVYEATLMINPAGRT